jgi:cell wall-associated NlpC family hydrolase
MTREDFVNRAIGMPWQKWRSDWQACDCYGLIALWHREVLGIELGAVPNISIEEGFDFALASGDWIQVSGPQAGATAWMAWRDGAPTHCGIVLDDCTLMHAEGGADQFGSVRVSRLAAVERVYGPITYHQHVASLC